MNPLVRRHPPQRVKAVIFYIIPVLTPIISLPSFAETGLGTIMITASRIPQPTTDILAAVTVITREDIERQQATSVYEVLRGVPGLMMTQNGGLGKINSVFLRGTESDHVLILLDGIKIGSATAGTTAFEQIPLEQIERIEIIRGPRSSLYGSEAIGGVIQFFTRTGTSRSGVQPSFSLGAGRYNTYQGSAQLSGSEGNARFNLGISRISTHGFNSCTGDPIAFTGCAAFEPDADGYWQNSGQIRLDYRLSPQQQLTLHGLRTTADNEYDGTVFGGNYADTLTEAVGIRLDSQWRAGWHSQLNVGQSRDESSNFYAETPVGTFRTRRQSWSWQQDIAMNTKNTQHQLSLGVDALYDRIHSTYAYTVTEHDNHGLFAQYLGHVQQHDWQASLRMDDNEAFGQKTTGGIAWGYTWSSQLHLNLSYSTAFKTPSFNELYFPGFGNPDLTPETANNFEIGLHGQLNGSLVQGSWQLALYQTHLDALIGFDPNTFTAINIDAARIRGLEFTAATSQYGLDWNAQLTWLEPLNKSAAYPDKDLPRRAKAMAQLDVSYTGGPYQVGTTLQAVGHRYDDLANTRKLAGYLRWDARWEYNLDKCWRIQAKLENITDERYETADFYPEAGRSLSLLLRYQPY